MRVRELDRDLGQVLTSPASCWVSCDLEIAERSRTKVEQIVTRAYVVDFSSVVLGRRGK
jgi:hypothetical protein